MIEAALNCRRYNLEIGGYIEIARCEKAVMSNVQDLSHRFQGFRRANSKRFIFARRTGEVSD